MAKGAPKVIPGADGSPERLNLAAVALRCGVSVRTVRDWVNEGRLPASKVGPKLWWVYRSDLDAFLGVPPAPAAVLGFASTDTAGAGPVAPVPEKPAPASPGGAVRASGGSSVPGVPPVVASAALPGLVAMDLPARSANKRGKKKR